MLGDGSEGPRSPGDVIKMAMREQGSKRGLPSFSLGLQARVPGCSPGRCIHVGANGQCSYLMSKDAVGELLFTQRFSPSSRSWGLRTQVGP